MPRDTLTAPREAVERVKIRKREKKSHFRDMSIIMLYGTGLNPKQIAPKVGLSKRGVEDRIKALSRRRSRDWENIEQIEWDLGKQALQVAKWCVDLTQEEIEGLHPKVRADIARMMCYIFPLCLGERASREGADLDTRLLSDDQLSELTYIVSKFTGTEYNDEMAQIQSNGQGRGALFAEGEEGQGNQEDPDGTSVESEPVRLLPAGTPPESSE